MNGNYYPTPTFPNASFDNVEYENNDFQIPGANNEQSYIENILRLNKGKKVKVYATFPDANDWRDKVFSGILEEAGKDHIIIRDTEKESWYLILMIYLNFVESNEKYNYNHDYSEKN